MIDLAKIRQSLVDKLDEFLPADVPTFRYPPDDLTDAPLVYVDLPTITGSLVISGGTTVRYPVVVVGPRTDHENAYDRLESLSASVWAALGDGRSTEIPPGMRGSCRSADPEQQTSADTTWPAVRFACDVEVGITC